MRITPAVDSLTVQRQRKESRHFGSTGVHPAITSEICDTSPCFNGECCCLCLLRKMNCAAGLCVQTSLPFRLNYALTDFLPAAPTCEISTGSIQINTGKISLFTRSRRAGQQRRPLEEGFVAWNTSWRSFIYILHHSLTLRLEFFMQLFSFKQQFGKGNIWKVVHKTQSCVYFCVPWENTANNFGMTIVCVNNESLCLKQEQNSAGGVRKNKLHSKEKQEEKCKNAHLSKFA